VSLHRKTDVGKPPASVSLVRLTPENYPDFSDDLFYDGIGASIHHSLEFYKKFPKTKRFFFGNDSYDADHMIRSLEVFLSFIKTNPAPETLTSFIRDNFVVYMSVGDKNTGDVLFTGYYELSLRGSLAKSDVYRYPIFSIPNDLVSIDLRLFSSKDAFKKKIIGRVTGENTVVPYYDRKEIGDGEILSTKSHVLAYVDSKIDLFFLEIQGSGIVYLDNGYAMRVHYHVSNGRPYKSIGAYLISSGKIASNEISAQKIREYLDAHPDEIDTVLNQNESFVFFKAEEGGPFGCYNVAITPARTIATDRRIFPACSLAFIKTKKPLIDGDETIMEWKRFGRFVMNQDTGGAIIGPGRVDLFQGNDTYAEITAGHMNNQGTLYFLVLKNK
jgi:membrane-bound lytic murein transglycosylase A